MIYMDHPRKVRVKFRYSRVVATAHTISTLPGEEGTRELVAFAHRIGSSPAWIQHQGQPKEHLDLIGRKRIDAAVATGVTMVDGRTLIRAIRAKRKVNHAPSLD